jgi:hypothetical protein
VNRKKIQRLWREEGLTPQPALTPESPDVLIGIPQVPGFGLPPCFVAEP